MGSSAEDAMIVFSSAREAKLYSDPVILNYYMTVPTLPKGFEHLMAKEWKKIKSY